MQPFTTVTGAAVATAARPTSTRMSSSASKGLTQGGDLGHYAFEALRYRPDGSPDPASVLNEPHFVGAPILLAGRNFGCGSSREGAVTGADGDGRLRCVIAPSFGDIFFANCFRNGMLPIVLPEGTVTSLVSEACAGDFTVRSRGADDPSAFR